MLCSPAVVLPPLVLFVLICFFFLAAGCIQNSRGQVNITSSPITSSTPFITTTSPVVTGGTDVNITLNSITRTDLIHGSHPLGGIVYIVVNMTLENHRPENYSFTPSMIKLNKHPPQMINRLDDPISFDPIPPGGRTQGEVLFGVWEVVQELTLELYDVNGTVLFSRRINDGPLTGYATSKSEKLQALMKNTDFNDVINQLDTPLLAAQYTNERFTYYDERFSYGYPPAAFFVTGKGDCCEFSWFFAYVLAAHGYDANMVSFKGYNKDGEYDGHVVAVFTEKDGQLRYATIPDLTKFRNASSIEGVLAQEKARLEFREIASYRVHQPVSTDSCHYN